MKYEISSNSAFPMVELTVDQNEELRIESGSMVYHDGNIVLEGKMNSNGSSGIGGLLKAVGRSITSGESFFITTIKGTKPEAKIAIAPATPGTISKLDIGAQQWRLNTGVFLACDFSVTYNMVSQSVGRALLGGTGGLFVMETAGQGTMLINSYGDLVEMELDGTKNFVVDNYHVVAWSSTLQYEIKAASGVFGFKTGEGLVNEFRGQGKVIIQTRNIEQFAQGLIPFLPKSN